MKTSKQVQFKQWLCNVWLEEYRNGRKAIMLRNANEIMEDLGNKTSYVVYPDTEDIAVATVNIPDEQLLKDEVIIKDYSENEGMYQALMESGIVSSQLRRVRSGFVDCPVCKLLI